MFSIRNKFKAKNNQKKVFLSSYHICNLMIFALSYVYIDFIIKNQVISGAIALTFLLVLSFIDERIIKKIYSKISIYEEFDKIRKDVLFFSFSYNLKEALIYALKKNNKKIQFREDDLIEEKIARAQAYYNNKEFDAYVYGLNCMKNQSKLKEFNSIFDEFYDKKIKENTRMVSETYKWIVEISVFFEIVFSLYQFFASKILISQNALIIHIILMIFFIIIYFLMAKRLTNDLEITESKRFYLFYIIFSFSDKPFNAFNKAGEMSNEFGKQLIENKNLFLDGDLAKLYDYIDHYDGLTKNYLLTIHESLIKNALSIKELNLKSNVKNSIYVNVLNILKIIPVFTLVILYVLEVFYK